MGLREGGPIERGGRPAEGRRELWGKGWAGPRVGGAGQPPPPPGEGGLFRKALGRRHPPLPHSTSSTPLGGGASLAFLP